MNGVARELRCSRLDLVRSGVCALAFALGSASCASIAHWGGQHADSEIWGDAFHSAVTEPEQALPTYALLVATPIAFAVDTDLVEDGSSHQPVTDGNTESGDLISLGLSAGSIVWGGVEWGRGDQGRSFEVAA